MLQGRPLLATAADSQLWVDRDVEMQQLERSVARRFNVLVEGERGIGKSSMLHHLVYRARHDARLVYADATATEEIVEMLGVVEDALNRSGEPLEPEHADLNLAEHLMPRDQLAIRRRAKVGSVSPTNTISDLSRFAPSVILLDATYAASPAYELFGRLRDDLWELDHRWIVAVDTDEAAQLDRPPADAFFDIILELSPFDASALVQLLERRDPGLPTSVLAQIAAGSEGNPRRALELTRQTLIEDRTITDVLAGRGTRERAARNLGRPHSMLLAVLEDADRAFSPSDQDLQTTMGWTPARLGQVFRELESAGIVNATNERQARGRPRKLYRPNRGFVA